MEGFQNKKHLELTWGLFIVFSFFSLPLSILAAQTSDSACALVQSSQFQKDPEMPVPCY